MLNPEALEAILLVGMRIGSLKLQTNLCLSPLAGYTNLPFRLVLQMCVNPRNVNVSGRP